LPEQQGDPDGGYVGAAFKKAIFDCDDSRPITANSEDTPGDTLTKVMDVNSFSYNYQEYLLQRICLSGGLFFDVQSFVLELGLL
jgi:hypothetical protein